MDIDAITDNCNAEVVDSQRVGTKTMPAMSAIVRDGKSVSLRQVPRPRPVPGNEVLIRVAVAGVCRTDLYVADGRIRSKPGRILGHECAGVVEEVHPSFVGIRPGEHVTIMPLISCRQCPQCLGNAPTVCIQHRMVGVDRDGAFAEFVLVPAAAVHRVPDSMPFTLAAYSEPVAAALAVFNAGIRPGDRGLIYGRNRFALLVHRLLLARGFANVTRFDPDAGKSPESNAYDFVIETVATQTAFSQMIDALKPRGALVIKSRMPVPVSFDFGKAVAKELTLRAVFYGSFTEAINLLSDRLLQIDDLLGPVFPLSDFQQVFDRARGDESLKLFLSPGGEHVRGL